MKPVGSLPKKVWFFGKILSGLVIIYVLVYTLFSANGQYGWTLADLGGIEGFIWTPAGLFLDPANKNERNWDFYMVCAFYPLERIDWAYFHPSKAAYITDEQTDNWMKEHQLNDFIHLARQLPPSVLTRYIIAVLGTPNRTNLLANGSVRWEYDYQSTNSLAFGSLFFNRHGVFKGSSTNANAETADLN